ncbi:hypothetical protein GCM10023324_09230 [Streptomyces youssoufiensis]
MPNAQPADPTPYWYQVGRPNRSAVDLAYPGRSSRSVSGTRFTETGTPSASNPADLPPIPEPSGVAPANRSAMRRSPSRDSAAPTVRPADTRAARRSAGWRRRMNDSSGRAPTRGTDWPHDPFPTTRRAPDPTLRAPGRRANSPRQSMYEASWAEFTCAGG